MATRSRTSPATAQAARLGAVRKVGKALLAQEEKLGRAMASRIVEEIPRYRRGSPDLLQDVLAGATATGRVRDAGHGPRHHAGRRGLRAGGSARTHAERTRRAGPDRAPDRGLCPEGTATPPCRPGSGPRGPADRRRWTHGRGCNARRR